MKLASFEHIYNNHIMPDFDIFKNSFINYVEMHKFDNFNLIHNLKYLFDNLPDKFIYFFKK